MSPLSSAWPISDALHYLYPAPRRDLLADIPLTLEDIGERGLLAAADTTHVGSWGIEPLGPENMLIASVTEPALLKGVCRLANDAHLRNLHAMLEQGIQVVFDSWFQCGLSVGWSPKTYREIFLPLVKEAVDLTHTFGGLYIYYDAGKMWNLVPLILETGTDAIAGLQPPDMGDVLLSEMKARYGNSVALVGGLDPVYTFDLGTAQMVREAVRQAIADAGAGGRVHLARIGVLRPADAGGKHRCRGGSGEGVWRVLRNEA